MCALSISTVWGVGIERWRRQASFLEISTPGSQRITRNWPIREEMEQWLTPHCLKLETNQSEKKWSSGQHSHCLKLETDQSEERWSRGPGIQLQFCIGEGENYLNHTGWPCCFQRSIITSNFLQCSEVTSKSKVWVFKLSPSKGSSQLLSWVNGAATWFKKGVCPLQQASCKLGDSPTHFPLLRYELRNPEVTTALGNYVQKWELSLDRPPLFLARIISL